MVIPTPTQDGNARLCPRSPNPTEHLSQKKNFWFNLLIGGAWTNNGFKRFGTKELSTV